MTGREWKPGDAALIRPRRGNWAIAFLGSAGEWVCTYGGGGHTHRDGGEGLEVRPLVVIDPEDREQIERLADELHHAKVGHRMGNCYPDEYDRMQDALREFADPKPPKPDEPTGLGAVIEDTQEELWVRAGTDPDDDQPWHNEDEGWLGWSDIDVAHVLSEGVAP